MDDCLVFNLCLSYDSIQDLKKVFMMFLAFPFMEYEKNWYDWVRLELYVGITVRTDRIHLNKRLSFIGSLICWSGQTEK